MIVLLVTLAALAIIIDLMALLLYSPVNLTIRTTAKWPKVSILVPMRNEEHNVDAFLEKILTLDYPRECLEILIGEDRSSDKTAALLKKQASLDSRIRIITVVNDSNGLKAKANVIDQLIPHCNSNYYFITDADVRLPAQWLKAYLSAGIDEAGLAGGTTVVKVRNSWSAIQNIDWMMAQGLLFVAGKIFGTVAISGTNMMITKKMCDGIGGYDKIPFWLTEDIGVLTAAKKAGFTGMNILDTNATAIIEAQPSWRALISQRSRWTFGVLRLPKAILIFLLLRSLFLICVILVAWWSVAIAIAMYLIKATINWVFVRRVGTALGQTSAVKHFLYFEVYWFLMSMGGLLTHLFSDTQWKGREYK